MSRLISFALIGLAFGAPPAASQDPIEAELDAFWATVVSSVENWDIDAQVATYHPDAISVRGDESSYGTRLIADGFAEVRDSASVSIDATFAVRFSLRVHDQTTAHEVGIYRFHAEGQEPFYGGIESYLVKKDGRWLILVEIMRREGLSQAAWDALGEG
ncbi:MAG: hypothetical protein WD205_01170 [Rhodothermales bacterium]